LSTCTLKSLWSGDALPALRGGADLALSRTAVRLGVAVD